MAINIQLEAFRAFANSDVAADQAAQMDKGEVTSAKTTASWLSRKFSVTDDAKTAIAENNRVRDALVSALKSQFGVDSFDNLPEQVKAALKGTHASSAAEDFSFNDANKAHSGRPLTKRRIEAVIRAVEREIGDAGADIPVSFRPLKVSVVNERSSHAQELVDSLMARFTANVNGEPLVHSRYEALARRLLTAFVENRLVHMGDGLNKHTFAALAKYLDGTVCNSWQLSMNWLDPRARTDENGTLTGGGAFRTAYVVKALEETIKAYNATHADSAFYEAREATPAEQAAYQRSEELSLPKAELTAKAKMHFLDNLCFSGDASFANPKTTDASFDLAEKDLGRSQLTTIGGTTFGMTAERPWDAAQKAAYRAKVREIFNNDEGMIRLFNGIAAQGFSAAFSEGRAADHASNPSIDQLYALNTPFDQVLTQATTFGVHPKTDGSFTMTYAFHRTGAAFVDSKNVMHALDSKTSYEDHRAEITFARAAEGTEGARKLEYTGDDGQRHTLWFTMSVRTASAETRLDILPSEE